MRLNNRLILEVPFLALLSASTHAAGDPNAARHRCGTLHRLPRDPGLCVPITLHGAVCADGERPGRTGRGVPRDDDRNQ